VKTLLALGADPTVKEKADWTPLQIAQQFEHDEVIELLKQALKKPGTYDASGVHQKKTKKAKQGTCAAGETCT
jgi:ankyrin repeat protein